MNKERKNIKKIKTMIEKNKHGINRIIVSEEFMYQLEEHADLVNLENKQFNQENEYIRNDITNKTEDVVDITFLFGVPCYLSNTILTGAILEMANGEFFILNNI